MSYILEALEKAEQSRLDTKLPDITSVPLSAEKPVRERMGWPYGALLVGVVGGATALGWWFSGKSPEKPIAEKMLVVAPAVPGESAGQSVPGQFRRKAEYPIAGGFKSSGDILLPNSAFSSVPVRLASAPPNEQVVTLSPKVYAPKPRALIPDGDKAVGKFGMRAKESDSGLSGGATVEAEKKASTDHVENQMSALAAVPPGPKAPAGLRIWLVDELPPDIRRHVPKISATGYVYSAEAGGRVVSVNERSLREGDELIAGMKLEQITQDYLLFGFRGYRFRVEMF